MLGYIREACRRLSNYLRPRENNQPARNNQFTTLAKVRKRGRVAHSYDPELLSPDSAARVAERAKRLEGRQKRAMTSPMSDPEKGFSSGSDKPLISAKGVKQPLKFVAKEIFIVPTATPPVSSPTAISTSFPHSASAPPSTPFYGATSLSPVLPEYSNSVPISHAGLYFPVPEKSPPKPKEEIPSPLITALHVAIMLCRVALTLIKIGQNYGRFSKQFST